MKKTIKLIFPHQLFESNPLFTLKGDSYLIEEYSFFKQYNFHKKKLSFHRATMKYYQDYMAQKGFSVNYIESDQKESDVTLLIKKLKAQGAESIVIVDPVDNSLLKRIKNTSKKLMLDLQILDSPMFLNTNNDLKDFFDTKKERFLQTEFYKKERVKRNILINKSGGPVGGNWTFDKENRKKYPKGKAIIATPFPKKNTYQKEADQYVAKQFSKNLGTLNDSINYPINYKTSKKWLETFLEERLEEFGDYQDSIVMKETLLNHSLLTPMLNVGLLTPEKVIKKTLEHSLIKKVPLNSLEGFIRQIIGWREFVRGIYGAKADQARTTNYWGFTRKIPKSFYTGTTGIIPVDETIKKVLETGYCHHIERLMILGNFMLLCEFNPEDVFTWFMELFIDAYDWVMVPNVYGMSQFADGGIMATKPYISGSNYITKMSNYPKGDWQEIWDCLFWSFLDKRRDFFIKNPRFNMLIKTFDKWDKSKQKTIHKKAAKYLSSLE